MLYSIQTKALMANQIKIAWVQDHTSETHKNDIIPDRVLIYTDGKSDHELGRLKWKNESPYGWYQEESVVIKDAVKKIEKLFPCQLEVKFLREGWSSIRTLGIREYSALSNGEETHFRILLQDLYL
ncbi:hypothetical protein IPF86_00690 [Candidatus Nomurabacteria bacterium]|nr:MAG: hypothetical protein IPF86_00690 [Candidatus Nomurabacteria bacterium]